MAGLNKVTSCLETSKVAWAFAVDVRRDEEFQALVGIHHLNMGIERLKEVVNNGERGCSLKKAVAYLGFRVISYSFIPTALNAVSLLVTAILSVLTLPFLVSEKTSNITRWAWTRCQGSFGFLMQSLFDVTCDFRQLTGAPCCAPESLYLKI